MGRTTMKSRPFADIAAEALADPVRRARIEERKRAIDAALALAELRTGRGVNQRAMAETLGVSQANVSRIEHEEGIYPSTLRKYVGALGGEIEITVVFPDEKVSLVVAGEAGIARLT
ncbi:MAG TPA: XRE family transcriptional regulator [Thermomicrobiales bacterium]